MTRIPGLLLILLLSAAGGNVQASAGDDAYAAGLAAARAGALEDAAAHFAAAQRAGMNTPALTYNIGVVSFKQNRLEDAAAAFQALTSDDHWRALAHYNLGLTEERRGNLEVAQSHFRQARDMADQPKLRALAERKLLARQVEALPGFQAQPRWHGIASIGAGYDDNVLLADDQLLDTVSDEADQFGEILAAARRPLGGVGSGLTLDVSAYYRFHADLDDFDFGSLSAGLMWRQPVGDWFFSTGVTGAAQFVGGDSYANVASHRLQFERRSGALLWRARNDFSYLSGASEYDFITGWRNRAQLQVSNRLEAGQLRLGYEFEANDRDDLEAGELFSSYSPRRHRLYAGAGFDFGPRFGIDVQGAVARSDYQDSNRFLDGDGNLQEIARDQDVLSLQVRLDYRLTDRWRLWSEYQHTNSDSDLLRYDYVSNAYQLGLETLF
ncbi:MAG: hypothetical protein ACNA7W_16100 [Pseudomonadales bacterium]